MKKQSLNLSSFVTIILFTFSFAYSSEKNIAIGKASIIGCILYNDCSLQPTITRDLIVSSNHFYSFFLLSILGFISYLKNNKKLIISYLFTISIFFEYFT